MKHKLFRVFHGILHSWRYVVSSESLSVVLALFMFATPALAATRFQQRSLTIYNGNPGVVTTYKIEMQHVTTVENIGSIDLLFCDNPIPNEPCVTPAGLDAAGAQLVNQNGETGFVIANKTTNHILLSRTPAPVTTLSSTYTLEGIRNPNVSGHAFSIRMRSHSSTNATGAIVNFGSVRSEITKAITIETQVPPMLIFCAAQTVEDNCEGTNKKYYSDMGDLTPQSTLTAQSQMAVGTNASGGFAITASGAPPAAGTSVIKPPTTPTESQQGKNQFGINLVANNAPTVGRNPEGAWANAIPAVNYGTANKYMYRPGDIVAYSPNVSLMKKFTVSYIMNSSPDLQAGVYTTTITYVASGRF